MVSTTWDLATGVEPPALEGSQVSSETPAHLGVRSDPPGLLVPDSGVPDLEPPPGRGGNLPDLGVNIARSSGRDE